MWSNVISSYKNICFIITRIIYSMQDILHLFFRKLHVLSCYVDYCQNLPISFVFILTTPATYSMSIGTGYPQYAVSYISRKGL